MKKNLVNKLSALSLLTILCFGAISPTIAKADTLDDTSYEIMLNDINNKILSEDTRTIQPRGFVSSTMIVSAFVKYIYMQSNHARHTLLNWYNADPYGYTRYIKELNNARYCCYNMCPKHRHINPYNYGFKNSYRCHN